MSEPNQSDNFFKKRWLPLLFLILGLALLWTGNQEYQQFQADVGDYVTTKPDNRTLWLLILGSAATVGGIIGVIRGRAL